MNRGTLAALFLVGWLAAPVAGQQTQLGSFSQNRQATYEVQPYDGQVLTTPAPSVWEGPPCPPANSLFGLGAGQTCFDSYTGWVGGAGVYYIRPQWDNNQAFIQAQSVAGVTTSTMSLSSTGCAATPELSVAKRASGVPSVRDSACTKPSESPNSTAFGVTSGALSPR